MKKDILNETPLEHLIRKLEEPSEPWEVWGERNTVHSNFTGKDWAEKKKILSYKLEPNVFLCDLLSR